MQDFSITSGFNPETRFLGPICVRSHDWNGSGQSLRNKKYGHCIECNRLRSKENFQKNRDQVLAYNKQYKRENRHKWKDSEKAYRSTDRAKRLNSEACKRYRESGNFDQWKESNRDYLRKLSNKHWHKRKALKLQCVVHPVSSQDISDHFSLFGDQCVYCGSKDVTIDHFIPVSKGGSHCTSNLVPACSRCNTSKLNKDPKVWYQSQTFYSTKRWKRILKVLGKTEDNYCQIPLL